MISPLRALLCVTAIGLVLAPDASAQGPRVGVEFQVNAYVTGNQQQPSVSMDTDGDFVVAYTNDGSRDTSLTGVFARRFSSAGSPLGAELLVNTVVALYQSLPGMVHHPSGDFVVVWESSGQDSSNEGIFLRRFSSAGTALGVELMVNAYTNGPQRLPAIAADADGDFVIVWLSPDGSSDGVFARRFSSTGAPVGGEFQVNTYSENYQRAQAVAMESDGDFVVAWQSFWQDGDHYGLFTRRFSSAGAPLTAELQLSAFTVAAQRDPSIAALEGGGFVVAWQAAGNQDGDAYGVFARRLSSAGSPLASELRVNDFTVGNQAAPAVAPAPGSSFVVTWSSAAQDGNGFGVFARRFSSVGAPLTGEFQVNTYTPGSQFISAVAAAGGDFVIVWTSQGQDGANDGLFGQLFSTTATLDVDGNGITDRLTDGVLVIRHLFAFTGPALTDDAIGGACTRCDSTAIAAYLNGLGATLDVDGNTLKQPLRDGLLVLRYLSDFSGQTLINGAVGTGCSRCEASEIEAYLDPLR